MPTMYGRVAHSVSQKLKIVKFRLAPMQFMPIIEINLCARNLYNWIRFSGGPRALKFYICNTILRFEHELFI